MLDIDAVSTANVNNIVSSFGAAITEHLYSEGSVRCSECGHTNNQFVFPVYGASGGLARAFILYICRLLPSRRLQVLPTEIHNVFLVRDEPLLFKRFLEERIRQLAVRGTLIEEFGDMGRAAKEDCFGR